MTLPKSHKNAGSGEHAQVRTHAPTGTTYGLEKGEHPNRKVGLTWTNPRESEDPLGDRLTRMQPKESDRKGPYGGGRF